MDFRRLFGGGARQQDEKPAVAEPEVPSAAPDDKPARAHSGDTPEPVAETSGLREQIVEVLQTVYDPEIPVNIHEIGLVYGIDIGADNHVIVRMTLTSPACPVAGSLPVDVENKVLAIPGVTSVRVELVWDPPWNPGMMSEAAKLQLGMF